MIAATKKTFWKIHPNSVSLLRNSIYTANVWKLPPKSNPYMEAKGIPLKNTF